MTVQPAVLVIGNAGLPCWSWQSDDAWLMQVQWYMHLMAFACHGWPLCAFVRWDPSVPAGRIYELCSTSKQPTMSCSIVQKSWAIFMAGSCIEQGEQGDIQRSSLHIWQFGRDDVLIDKSHHEFVKDPRRAPRHTKHVCHYHCDVMVASRHGCRHHRNPRSDAKAHSALLALSSSDVWVCSTLPDRRGPCLDADLLSCLIRCVF